MKIALITDTHLGHSNVIKYDNRKPDHEARILRGIANARPDVLIHLGDVAFGNHEHWHQQIVEAAGDAYMWLVRGNHDTNSMTWYIQHGWHFVGDMVELDRFGLKIQFTHRPLPYDVDDGAVNIHGHQHRTVREGRRIGLHLPDNHYRPYSLDSLVHAYLRGQK